MMDIAEISAAPHFPKPLQAMRVRDNQNALSEFMSTLCGLHDISVRELNGELHIVCAANRGD
jgi:hypothetical protein